MKLLLIAALMVFGVSAQDHYVPDDFAQNLVVFHEHYDKFIRAFMGCPEHAASIDQCDVKVGTVDYQEYFAARKAAKKLFDLKDADNAVAKGQEPKDHRK